MLGEIEPGPRHQIELLKRKVDFGPQHLLQRGMPRDALFDVVERPRPEPHAEDHPHRPQRAAGRSQLRPLADGANHRLPRGRVIDRHPDLVHVMRQAVLAGAVRPSGDDSGDGLFIDQPDRGGGEALPFQIGQQLLDLAARADPRPNPVLSRLGVDLVEVPQVQQHLVTAGRLAPGMQSAHNLDALPLVLAKDLQHLRFRPRRVLVCRFERDVATEVVDHDWLKLHESPPVATGGLWLDFRFS